MKRNIVREITTERNRQMNEFVDDTSPGSTLKEFVVGLRTKTGRDSAQEPDQ